MLSFSKEESVLMKFMKFLGIFLLLITGLSAGAFATNFQDASKLLVAARRGDIQTVQVLINSGVDINYVDSTGLSLVCTAVMNNDTRAIQILQMYGADSSDCDRQIKKYNQRTKLAANGEEYGFFSGLSSTHVIVLSAIGVAAVLGGVVLLTKAFDDNDGGHSSSGTNGDRPNNNNNGGGSNSSTATNKLFAQNLPGGPACSGTSCPSDYSYFENNDFEYMSQNGFNYLMVARAYDAFVRGYFGLSTVRNDTTKEIFDLSKYPFVQEVGGGKPINVAMVTGSGVNATGSAVDDLIYWFDESKKSSLITLCASNDGTFSEACQAAVNASVMMSHKYSNYSGVSAGTGEDAAFDLSGSGTVFGLATEEDTKLAKVIAGWKDNSGDFYGFIPNGQLTVYKTGNGSAWVDTTSDTVTGAYTLSDDVLSTITLADGTVLTVSSISNGYFVAEDSDSNVYNGYIDGNNLYVGLGNNINQLYTMGDENALTLTKELQSNVADYKNYAAIYNVLQLNDAPNVIANLSLPALSVNLGYATVGDAKVAYGENDASFLALIDNYYNLNLTDNTNPSTDANNAFIDLGKYGKQILVNSAGRSILGIGDNASLSPKEATFENFAPAAYDKLQNLFMTVVALSPKDGTGNITEISNYSAAGVGTLELSTWEDANDSSIIYSSRVCGLTGSGNCGAMNPWCFAAPGATDLEATAAMAGSVALVKSAFNYMTPKEVFLLLALTADGPYLGTDPTTGSSWKTKDGSSDTNDLISYLKNMYTLPGNFDTSNAQYLESFKNAFGYGMINLERATRPGTNVYFYSSDTDTIVSGSKIAYWRNAAASQLHSSSALSLVNRGAIKTSFFDVIESADGTLSLPRVWNMTFVGDAGSKHGLYMGDVLADFNVDSTNQRSNQIGDFTFDMSMSDRAYDDGLHGLDNLRVAFRNEKYDVDAGYQHFLTDGESRFAGRANGVLSLVSDSITTGAKYKFGNFVFGGRAFSGAITDENLLENDPAVSSQFEPARLGLANGAAMEAGYKTDKFKFNLAFGNLHESDTVLGLYSDGILAMRGADTQYIDVVSEYKPFEKVKLTVRGTFANTDVDNFGGVLEDVSSIKSNAFAVGADVGGFSFTAAMPLATVAGRVKYSYADFSVVENDGAYEVVMNDAHVESIDLAKQKRELRFSSSYKKSIDESTDAGVGFIYRVNPNNTSAFGNESVFMFKMHHIFGI